MNKAFGIVAALTFGAFITTGTSASALTLATGDTTCSISDVSGSTDCEGAFSGNNSNQDLNGLFGVADWGDELKVDASSGTNNALTVGDDGDGKTGTWSVDIADWSGYDAFMIVLKGGPTFSAYLMDLVATNGTWSTAGILTGGGKAGPGLSHFSIYAVQCDSSDPDCDDQPPVTFVPVPAGLPLVLSGLGIMGILRARKRKSA